MTTTIFCGSLLAAVICTQPLLYGNIPEAIQKRAAFVCYRDYNGCVASIREVGEQSYRVTCRRMTGTFRISEK